jgi:cation diffusion facilitator family transporter
MSVRGRYARPDGEEEVVSPTQRSTAGPTERLALVRRGQLLSRVALGYNALEGIASVTAGAFAGSVALIGFGIDSLIEVTSSGASLWRLRSDHDPGRRERSERVSLRIIGLCFIGLAIYIGWEAGHSLWRREQPEKTTPGIVIAALSVVIMPILARSKRRVATALGSRALEADARQTDLCMYLSAIVLGGLLLNAVLGWWWADPVAALIMVPIIAKEGIEGLRGEERCDDCLPVR